MSGLTTTSPLPAMMYEFVILSKADKSIEPLKFSKLVYAQRAPFISSSAIIGVYRIMAFLYVLLSIIKSDIPFSLFKARSRYSLLSNVRGLPSAVISLPSLSIANTEK